MSGMSEGSSALVDAVQTGQGGCVKKRIREEGDCVA